MMLKSALDRCIALGSAISAPVLTLLVDQHVLSAQAATDVGGIIVALVAGYHGGATIQAKSAARAVPGQP